ncbi:MAG: family 16 glycosylhydrolase [Gammaproteobacteria bacterium]|nr:family 16 glycosylhydrolase [Gammaproteobacteria bacterium]NNF60684.1 family 16 glycosylhydrolase [Gammaproteobacteria bacterium]NNM19824.1 family 16 glycosylhydrolase [Gammaproteobacteria bacterium]
MHSEPYGRITRLAVAISTLLLLAGCFSEGEGKQQIRATPLQLELDSNDDEFILVFEDNFDVDGEVDASKWNIETGYGENNSGWGNDEWQLYTNATDNVRVEGGNLVLEARCDTPPCGKRNDTITSGRINTLDNFEFRYGRIEARIKPPVGKGAWPAFWSLGANFPEIGWPNSGEIDFMEIHNGLPSATSTERHTHFTMHWCDQRIQAPEPCTFPNGRIFDSQNRDTGSSLGDDFHIFEAEWTEDRIIGKIDGATYFSRAIDPSNMEEFRREFFLILNVAMGGTLGSNGASPDGTETFPQTMLVDYVRVYQLESDIIAADEPKVIDFEPDGAPYNFTDFEGGVGFVTPNPEMDGNTSANVAKLLKFAGGQTFAGTTLALNDPWNTADGTTFTAKVWGNRPDLSGVNLTFKLEPLNQEVVVTHGNTGWEELTFEVPAASGEITGITFILDNGVPGATPTNPPSEDPNWTFLIDDIAQVTPDDGGGGGPGGGACGAVRASTCVADFEPGGAPYTFVDFEGGVGFVTENPEPDGNTSANVAKLLKFAGGANFAGTTLQLNSPLDTANGTTFTAKVWGNRPDLSGVNLTFKLEPLGREVVVTHGNTGWEDLTFELPAASGTITGITFILDNGVPGAMPTDPPSEDPNWTILIDDIAQVSPDDGGDGGDPSGNTVDFEPSGGPYAFTDFEGGVGFVTENPETDGNSSANVAKLLKFAGGANFAGTTLQLPTPWDTANGTTFTAKVWGERPDLSGVALTFKLEPLNQEVVITHGNTGWEELTFELPAASGTITGITLILDNGVPGATPTDPPSEDPNWTILIDDITQVSPGAGEGVISDFEGSGDMFNDFQGGVGSVVANPDMGGINTSALVGRMQKFSGATFAGTTLKATVDAAVGTSFTMKVWSQRAVNVLFKLEDGGAGVQVEVAHGGSGWELLTFDLPAASGSYSGITFIFDDGIAGNADGDPDNWTFYFDDITQVAPDGGGGDPGPDSGLVSDFEADPNSYDFGATNGFGGGQAFVIDNPVMEGINTSAQVVRMQKFSGQVFGGATLTLDTPLNVAAGSTFTIKVWSQREVRLLFKLESAMDDDVELTHSGSGWEEMSFEFPTFSGSVDGISFFFDIGVNGEAATNPDNWTFYFDDITLIAPAASRSMIELVRLDGGDSGRAVLIMAARQQPEFIKNSFVF